MNRRKLLLVMWVSLLLAGSTQAQIYSLTDLGVVPPRDTSIATSVSNGGYVAGNLQDSTFLNPTLPFSWFNGNMTVLSDVDVFFGTGSGVNNAGTVAGTAFSFSNNGFRAFYNNGTYNYVAPLIDGARQGDFNQAFAINNAGSAGVLAGASTITSDTNDPDYGWTYPFIHDIGTNTTTRLPVFNVNSDRSAASAISNNGFVAGESTAFLPGSPPFGTQRAFRWAPGDVALTPIPVIGENSPATDTFFNVGRGVNDAGLVVGTSVYNVNANSHAFLWDGVNPTIDLGSFAGEDSDALGINVLNQIVGWADITAGAATDRRAFLLTYSGNPGAPGTMLDLITLVDSSGAGWTLEEAQAINDLGWIVGYGTIGGQQRAFLLRPTAVPEPASIAIASLTIAAVGGLWYRRRSRQRLAEDEAALTVATVE